MAPIGLLRTGENATQISSGVLFTYEDTLDGSGVLRS
jgi:hypothetical protein